MGRNGEFLPTNQGFQSYYGLPYSHDLCPFISDCYPDSSCDAPSPHPFTSPCPLFENQDIIEQPVKMIELTQKMTQRAASFIRDAVDEMNPFFLYFAFNHVHFPQFSGSQFRNSSSAGSYGDSVAEMDDAVGTIINTLKEMK